MSPFLIAFDADFSVVMAADYIDAFDLATRLIDAWEDVKEVVVREIDGGEYAEFIRDLKQAKPAARKTRTRKPTRAAV